MSKPSPAAILADLTARGLISQTTPGLAEHLQEPRALYCGFDPTAESLHIGSLVPLLTLRRFQQYGHTPYILVGGATGLIGDPSFKAQERKLNTTETVVEWSAKLKAQTFPLVNDPAINTAQIVNNITWTEGINVLTFLRDIGKHFSVNNLIAKEAIKSRLEREDSGISFTEFTYPLLQALDFAELNKQHNVTLQLGGSDQWGNMVAGTELIRKTTRKEAHVLTLPLVTKADGTKFGKTESGAIWLSAQKTSPYTFYQYWLNTPDAEIERMMFYFSFRSPEQIRADDQPGIPRYRQTILAKELTELVHGPQAREAAERISHALFSADYATLTESDYAQLALDGLPTSTINQPINLVDGLVAAGLASSKREAREFIQGNAVTHNGAVQNDEATMLQTTNATFGRYHLLKRGKKNFALLVHGQ
jgi:tyrosyl-tRNA synthetase